jgi:transposase-like protein
MSSKRYTEEFKIETVKQVTACGYSASEVARHQGPGRIPQTAPQKGSKKKE